MRKRFLVVPALLGLWLAGLIITASDERLAANDRLRFTALAANLSTTGTGQTNRVDITIDRWSTDEEHEALRDELVENGTDAVYEKLQDMKPVGRISVDSGLGWDLRYAREVNDEGKRRIVFATDRPISVREAYANARTLDYKFMVGELRVGSDGRGEGQISPAVKLRYEPGLQLLELENFASEPIRLLQVRPL